MKRTDTACPRGARILRDPGTHDVRRRIGRAGCRLAAVRSVAVLREVVRLGGVQSVAVQSAAIPIVVVLFSAILGGCGYYSFTGATIPTHLSTLAVPLAEDRSVGTVSGLDEMMTRFLVNRFVGQTRLSLEPVESNADAVLEATIDRYSSQPTSVGGQEVATRNRVTISVTVVYTDQVEDKEILRRSFSAFAEFDELDPTQKEEDAAQAALEKIADDVFTAATSNW